MEILFASQVAMCLHMSLSDNNDTSKLFFSQCQFVMAMLWWFIEILSHVKLRQECAAPVRDGTGMFLKEGSKNDFKQILLYWTLALNMGHFVLDVRTDLNKLFKKLRTYMIKIIVSKELVWTKLIRKISLVLTSNTIHHIFDTESSLELAIRW